MVYLYGLFLALLGAFGGVVGQETNCGTEWFFSGDVEWSCLEQTAVDLVEVFESLSLDEMTVEEQLAFLEWFHDDIGRPQDNNGGIMSYYSPSLCYNENGEVIQNINCDSNPANAFAGTINEMWYEGAGGYWIIACDLSMINVNTRMTTYIHVPAHDRTYVCLDGGGGIKNGKILLINNRLQYIDHFDLLVDWRDLEENGRAYYNLNTTFSYSKWWDEMPWWAYFEE